MTCTVPDKYPNESNWNWDICVNTQPKENKPYFPPLETFMFSFSFNCCSSWNVCVFHAGGPIDQFIRTQGENRCCISRPVQRMTTGSTCEGLQEVQEVEQTKCALKSVNSLWTYEFKVYTTFAFFINVHFVNHFVSTLY